MIEAIILVIHIFAFFGILVSLWVLAPVNASPKQVFTQFSDGGGWQSLGGSALIGITSGIYPLIGGDAAVHMSEELRDAGKTLPQCMIWTTVVNGALAWIMAITFCFCVGDLEEALNSPTGANFLIVFFHRVLGLKMFNFRSEEQEQALTRSIQGILSCKYFTTRSSQQEVQPLCLSS